MDMYEWIYMGGYTWMDIYEWIYFGFILKVSAENCLKVQTVQHFCCPEWQKCCTVYRKLHAWADSTALLYDFHRKSHRSIGDLMGVNSHITGPDLEGSRG